MVSRPRNSRRPDAPSITSPCPECYRTFWSWKALFGHMRCHPTRQYRGMNPPENFRRRRRLGKAPVEDEEEFTEEDHELASCLLLLTNGSGEETAAVGPASSGAVTQSSSGFECSSCKKVFNSHQALGGHRATHKNVKGCYAIGCCSSAAAGEPTSPIDLNLSAADGRSFIGGGGLILDLKLGL
ncbi:hypothetical protein M569_03286 [Genlisea aurea]|uniref:C2H2-type domain-containing protein n=1 Tax=Genlisea aurea TaxID=192259 RepID=S8CX52_9LAMI|nr:hypothetical protein M569_03286 [Genlisea aurea]